MKIFRKIIQKIKGKGNIAIANSPGAIVYQGDVANEIAKNIIDNPSEIAKQYEGIKNILQNIHPYYSFLPSGSSGELIPVPKNKEALEKCPLKVKLNYIFPEKLKKFKNWKEAFIESYKSQTPIEIEDVKYFEILLGHKLFNRVQADIKKGETIKAVFKPQEFPPPRPVKIYVEDNENIGFDYIELGLKRIEGDNIVLSNEEEQNRKIDLELKVNFIDQNSQFNFELVNKYRNRAQAIYNINKLVALLMDGKPLIIKDLKDEGVLKVCGVKQSSLKPDLEYEKLLKIIINIEECFQTTFNLPNIIGNQNIKAIELLDNIMKKGEVILKLGGGFTFCDVSKKGVLNILSHVDINGYLNDLRLYTKEKWKIFGKELDLGEVGMRFPQVRVSNTDALNEQLETMEDDDLIDINFELADRVNNELVKEYKNYTSE